MPPTRLRRRDALDQRIASLTRKTWPSAASGYQAMFALKVSKDRRTRRRLLMDYTFEDVSKLSALIFDGL